MILAAPQNDRLRSWLLLEIIEIDPFETQPRSFALGSLPAIAAATAKTDTCTATDKTARSRFYMHSLRPILKSNDTIFAVQCLLILAIHACGVLVHPVLCTTRCSAPRCNQTARSLISSPVPRRSYGKIVFFSERIFLQNLFKKHIFVLEFFAAEDRS